MSVSFCYDMHLMDMGNGQSTLQSTLLVKICGTTSIADAQLAEQAGANYVGIIIEHEPSPRSVSLAAALAIAKSVQIPVVAVTVNLPRERLLEIHRELCPAVLQLHGDEAAETIRSLRSEGIKVWAVASGDAEQVRNRAAEFGPNGVEAILVDARTTTERGTIYGGTGHTSDWQVARELVQSGYRIVLAGGLNPQNVAQAVSQVRPWMVDVVSGVEAHKGRKDADKVYRFVAAAKSRVDICPART